MSVSGSIVPRTLLRAVAVLAALTAGVGARPCRAYADEANCSTKEQCEEQTAMQAQAAYKAKDYQRAVELYQKAYAMQKDPQFLLGLGRSYVKLCAIEQAQASFAQFHQEQPSPPLELAEAVNKYEAEVKSSKMSCDAPKNASLATQTPKQDTTGKPPADRPRSKVWLYGLFGGLGIAAVLGVGLGVGLGLRSSEMVNPPTLRIVPLER